MRVLIAPQEFKGSLTAGEAALAIASGIGAAQSGWTLDLLPFSDGGPGFIDAVGRALPAEPHRAVVHDAIGRKVEGRFLFLADSRIAVVEAAQANGLMHLAPAERDPLHADSYGVGELVTAALDLRPAILTIGVGGSATSDGGVGMARALGARFYDGAGNSLAPGGAALTELVRIEWARPVGLAGIEVVVATDVTNPLVGPNGAAVIYGPQKGASPEEVDLLESALLRYAAVVRRQFGIDVAHQPGAGAAGGLAAGLIAFLGARVESGFDWVAKAAGLDERLVAADVVVSGEGSFDAQSLQGKVTGRLMELAAASNKPCVIFAGTSTESGTNVRTLSDLEPDPVGSIANAQALLTALAHAWASELPTRDSG